MMPETLTLAEVMQLAARSGVIPPEELSQELKLEDQKDDDQIETIDFKEIE